MILKDVFGKALPRYQTSETTPAELAALVGEKKNDVRRVDVARPGDILLLRIAGHPVHVGICVDDYYMVHSLAGHDSALERYVSPKWSRRIEGIYHVD